MGMPRNASGMPKTSSNARVIARPPAPPVSTNVPSMSNSTSRRVTAGRLGFAADVAGAGAFRGRLLFEADPLPFIELVEAALHRAAMEEPLLAAVVANEPEAAVSNESLDRPCRHPNVSLGAHVPEEPKESNFVPA